MNYYIEIDRPGIGSGGGVSEKQQAGRNSPILELVSPLDYSSECGSGSPWSQRRGSSGSESSIFSFIRKDSSGSMGSERKDSSVSLGDEEPRKKVSDKIYDIAILMKIKKTWKNKKATREEAAAAEKVPPAEFWW